MNLFKSLTHRPFALLWSGQSISRLGDSLYQIAMAWWVLQKTGSAAAMGTVLIFSSVPMLIFLLIGGVFTDRFPRLKVMLISDILSGVVVATVAALAFASLLEVWHVYIASIVFGLVKAFFFPAYTAAVPEITPGEMLTSANSLTNLGQRGASIVGPALAATIVAFGGTSLAFGLDALSFFVSAVCIFLIVRSYANFASAPVAPAAGAAERVETNPRGVHSVLMEIKEGYLAVIASPWLWITIVVFSLVNAACAAPMAVSLPFLVKVNLQKDVGTLGFLTSMSSLGFVIGALVLGQFARLKRRGLLGYLSTFGMGALIVVFGLTTSLPLLAAAAFLSEASIAVFGLIWTNTLQELVPRHLLGRVSSIDALGSFVLLPIGFGIAGWATDLAGAPLVFMIGGGSTMLLVLLALTHPAIRGLD